MRHRKLTALLVVGSLTLAACGGGGSNKAKSSDTTRKKKPTTTEAPVTESSDSVPTSDTVDANSAPYQEILDLSLKDIQDFWRDEFPKLYGAPYKELQGGIFAVTPDNAGQAPGCGTPALQYSDVEGNAFYCSAGDFVAYDNAELFPTLFKQFGAFILALVLGHEWGHEIQARAGVEGPTILLEQQADCFAGVWSKSVASGESKNLVLDAGDLDIALGGFLQFRDEPGTLVDDPQAHGSAFDRVNAFQDGFDNGPEKCKAYPDNPPPTMEIPFTDQADQQSGGNLPFDQVQPLVVTFLDRFYSALLKQNNIDYTPPANLIPYTGASDAPTACGNKKLSEEFLKNNIFYCPDDDYIAWDNANLMPNVYKNIGDFAVGQLIANAWADAMQNRLGVTLSGKDRSLQADCMTGSWTADIVKGTLNDAPGTPNGQSLTLSPGDLDEAVTAFVAFGDSPTANNDPNSSVGTAFERVASFRAGFLDGVSACFSTAGGSTGSSDTSPPST